MSEERADEYGVPVAGVISETVIVCGPEAEGAGSGESGSLKERVAEKVGVVSEKVSEKMSSAYESSRAGISEAAHRIREGAASGAESLRDAAASTADSARDVMCALRAQIQSRPLVCLAAAFGIGLVIGKLIDLEREQRSSRWWR
jgi:ElaB/YqjD/DUF883 family membrane-anchored ribosome-binding protein